MIFLILPKGPHEICRYFVIGNSTYLYYNWKSLNLLLWFIADDDENENDVMLLRQFPDFNRPKNFKTLGRIGNESELLFGMKQSDGMTKLKHF